MRPLPILLLAMLPCLAIGQTPDTSGRLRISGYLEAYLAWDLGQDADNERPDFIYSYDRTREVTINLGMLKASYGTTKVRANLAFMAGTYTNANLAAEPGVLKHLFEGNAGVRLSNTHDLWLDAGVFPSHIGAESAIGMDCWTVSRSLQADNSPYYESGLRISYTTDDGRWYLSGLVLNGWQRIQRPAGNTSPAFGHQLTFRPRAGIILNSSSFIGSDTPDHDRRIRVFHNLYGTFRLHDRLDILLGLDLGAQQREPHTQSMDLWHSPIAILRWTPSETVRIAARAERYMDDRGIIIPPVGQHGFRALNLSANLDFRINDQALWRFEFRTLQSPNPIFTWHGAPSRKLHGFTTSLSVAF